MADLSSINEGKSRPFCTDVKIPVARDGSAASAISPLRYKAASINFINPITKMGSFPQRVQKNAAFLQERLSGVTKYQVKHIFYFLQFE